MFGRVKGIFRSLFGRRQNPCTCEHEAPERVKNSRYWCGACGAVFDENPNGIGGDWRAPAWVVLPMYSSLSIEVARAAKAWMLSSGTDAPVKLKDLDREVARLLEFETREARLAQIARKPC